MSSNENKRLHREVDGDDDTKEILANTKLRRTMAPPHWLLVRGDGDDQLRAGPHAPGYVVAALEQAILSGGEWYVSFFSSSTGSWRRKAARLPPELAGWHHQWEVLAVLACGGRFWWLDLRRGLLSCSCDTLLRDEEDGVGEHTPPLALEFTLLPHITMEQAMEAGTSKYPPVQDRRFMASGGRLRYVALRRHRPGRSAAEAPEPPALCDGCRGGTITTWTLDDDDRRAWAEDRTVSVADVWRGESYRSTGLPRNAPGFPLLDPFDPDVVVYMSVMEEEGRYGKGHELCVDLRTKRVKSCSGRYEGLNYLNDTLEPVTMASSRREP